MIRFFRQLRQRLLTENRLGRYLLYAAGEIVLVVIGILIALQINTWNQEREQQKTVKRYLASLVQDLHKDLELAKWRSDQSLFRFHSAQQLLKLAGENPVRLAPEESIKPFAPDNIIWSKPLPEEPDSLFIAMTFLQSIRATVPIFSRSALNEMTSTGAFSLIRNEAVKDAIYNYYYIIDWRYGDLLLTQRQEWIKEWKISLAKDGVLPQDISHVAEPLELIRHHPERIGYLRNIIRSAWFEHNGLEQIHEQATNLIQLIETEIGPNPQSP